jgi:hypothetical protein
MEQVLKVPPEGDNLTLFNGIQTSFEELHEGSWTSTTHDTLSGKGERGGRWRGCRGGGGVKGGREGGEEREKGRGMGRESWAKGRGQDLCHALRPVR